MILDQPRKFEVKSIRSLISHIDAYVSERQRDDIALILITTREYDFDFNDIPVLHLRFLDVSEGQPGFITQKDVKKLHEFLQIIKEKKSVYISCDQGMNRSPAVALALAEYLNLPRDIHYIKSTFNNPNYEVFTFIKNNL